MAAKRTKKKLKAILTKSLRVLLNKLSYYPSITHASNDGILKKRISGKMKEKGKAKPDPPPPRKFDLVL